MPRLCDFETCRKQASYGEYYGKPLRCKEHKEKYILVNYLCQENNCKLHSNFNFKGEDKVKFCSKHKLDGMIDVKHKTCEYLDCKVIPSFNFEGQTTRKFCSIHKQEGMINFNSKYCEYNGCKNCSSFNFKEELKAKFCSIHKEEEMINFNSKHCEYNGCKKMANSNFEGKIKSKFCSIHKEEGMINIKNKMCQHPECKTMSIFNFEGKIEGKYCSTHKEEGMINVKNKNRICQHPECKAISTFNFEEETKSIFCGIHKKEGMIDISHKKCQYFNCKTIPNFNFEGQIQAKFCSTHKEEGMIDIKNKKCKANFCLGTRASIKFKGYCAPCYQHLFPLDPLTYQIRSKTKEIATRDYINENFVGFQHDKPLFTGNCDCTSRRRIDHRILIGNTLLCVETDENQHKSYDKKDEEIRYDDLFMIHSGKFVFIRFNPDKYINKNNKSVNPMLYTRLNILKEEIEKQIERIKKEENTELLEIIKLYYTGYN
jgi:hypothetical protein